MSLEVIWLSVLTAAVAGLAVALAWMARRSPGAAVAAGPADAVRRPEAEDLERRLSRRIDSVLALVDAQSSVATLLAVVGRPAEAPNPAGQEAAAVADPPPLPPAPSSPVPRATGPFVPQFELAPEEVSRRLESLLNNNDEFSSMVWPRMVDDFHSSRQAVLSFLQANGLTALEIQPYPPLPDGNANHWMFMSISPRSRRNGARRFLVPRRFVRYDPSFHGHLFKLRSGDDLEMFIRRLHRCAIVKAEGEVGREIAPEDVESQGEISVGGGEAS